MRNLIACLAMLTMVGVANADVTNYWPNGHFDSPAGTNAPWQEFSSQIQSGATNISFSYPISGGNPAGYAIIDNFTTYDGAGFGILIGGEPSGFPIAPLGMVPGGNYNFIQDMKTIDSGGGILGGLKIECYGPTGALLGSSGDMTAGSESGTWETYFFNYTLELETAAIKVVPLWGQGAKVGYDNIGVIIPPQAVVASITSPADGATIGSPVFTITASAAVSPGAVTNVSFYDGAILLGSDSTYPFSFSYASTPGPHSLRVVARDNSGLSATSAVVNVTTLAGTTVLFSNGNFSLPGGAHWVTNAGGGTFAFGYPATGGNPGGYAVITNTDATGFAVLIAGDTPLIGDPIPIAPLGLVAGETYTFVQDMKTFVSGGGLPAGLKIESWGPDGEILPNSGAMRLGESGAWATYYFSYTLNPGTTGIKVVPLWGQMATVGFDNIGVIVPLQALLASITSPLEGSTNSNVFFTIQATAVVSPAAVTNLSFYDGAALLGSDSTYPYSFIYSNAPIGNRTLTVVAKDNSGASITSDVVNVVIANLAPAPLTYPTNDAPTPIWPAVAVKSLRNSSGTYTDKTNVNWYAQFGSTTIAGPNYTITNTGSVVLKYRNLSYIGVELDPTYAIGGETDLSGKTHMHVDLWTTANQFGIKLVTQTLPNLGTKFEAEYRISDVSGLITSNNWVSLDIPLSEWTNLNSNLNLSKLIQILWTDNFGTGVQNGTYYIDNVYFYNTTPVIQSPAKSGGNFTLKVASVSGSSYVLEATPTLSPPNWTGILTNAGTGGLLNFSTPITAGNKFFRIKTQ